ncbi:co-chaperone GroES [Candidatus Kaiserbacteria bacterium]|nr:co-chaperone GroES [Candidatus Kaiserbacteria bacterium]
MPEASKIKPLGDRVVVRPLTAEEEGTVSASGIIIPDTADKEKPAQGVVVSVGPGKFDDGKREPMDVSLGDRVIFSKYGYEEVEVEGDEYYIISASNILGVINA